MPTLSLFNYITFAETTTTKVEKQFIQQQQEQEQAQEQIIGQEQQEHIQAEQTVHRKTKTKKHKKHTDIIQQEQKQQLQQETRETFEEQRETFAEESNTEAPTIETLEQIEELLAYSTKLSTQNLSQSAHETIPVSVTTELSTPTPKAAQVQNELLAQKTLAVNEECLVFDEVSSSLDRSTPATSELTEQVEVRERHAASITEMQTKETHKELKSSKIPKLVQAERKIKESRPLLIETPSIADSFGELESLKAPTQQAHGEILYSHELTSEQQSTLDSVESFKTPTIGVEKAQPQFLEKESLLITESFRGETVEKEAPKKLPNIEQVSPKLTSSHSLGVSEWHPEDSVMDIKPAEGVRAESTSMSIQEFKAFSTSETSLLESEKEISTGYKPTKSTAEISIKPEERPLVVQEVEILESLSDEKPLKQRHIELQAVKQLVLLEGLVNTTAEARSPIEENLPMFKTESHEATSSLETQSHIITQETVFNEDGPQGLALEKIPEILGATSSHTSSLTVGETQEMQLVENTENLNEPTIEPAKPAKKTLTRGLETVVGNQESIYDTLESIEQARTKLNQGKVNITEGELVAEVHTQTAIDSEQRLLSEVPDTAKAKLNFIEQKALDVKQETGVEKENSLFPEIQILEQAAMEKVIPAELKVSSVWEVQHQFTPADIQSDNVRPASASQAFESKPVGLSSEQKSLKGTDYLKLQQQPELKSGRIIMGENQQPLEVTAVQVIESSELIESAPHQIESKAQKTKDTFNHAEHMIVTILESTKEHATESKPTAALADFTMPTQIGTDITEQALLETLQSHQQSAQPHQQISGTNFDLLQSLDTSSVFALEQEIALQSDEYNATQNAAIETVRALQVPNKSSSQHLESVQDLGDKTQPSEHQALVNIGETTIPECEEVASLDAVKDYLAPPLIESFITNMQIIENTSSLNTTTAIVSEETGKIEEPIILHQIGISPKLTDFTKKSALLEEPNVLEHAANLSTFSPTLEARQPTFSSFDEIHVQETKAFEKEVALEDISQPVKQLVKVSLDSTTGIVVSQRENTFELERDLEVPSISFEQAKCVDSELLKLPLTEGVEENQSAGDLASFTVSNNFAKSSIDVLTETTTTEAIVYDNVLTPKADDQPKCISSQSMIPHEHKMISECMLIGEVEEFLKTQEKQITAKRTQDTFSQSAIKEDQNTLEAEISFDTERSQEFNAKVSEAIPALYTKGVNEIEVYETISETKPSETLNKQEAGISHLSSHAPIINLQQTIESAGNFLAVAQASSAATSSDNACQLKLAVNTSIQTVEDANEFITSTSTETVAQPKLEGHHFEVTVMDSQYVEDAESISPYEEVATKATESMNTKFKATSESEEVHIFQKETVIQSTQSQGVIAKPGLSDILQYTTTTDTMPYELSENIKHAESKIQKAQVHPYIPTSANKLNVQIDDLILQKEDTFLNTNQIAYVKPFIEGTQSEMQICEIIPIENIDSLDVPKITAQESTRNVTSTPETHKTISEVAVYEKADELKYERPKEGHGTKLGDSDTKCANVTTIQTGFIKEGDMAPLSFIENNVHVSSTEKESLVTEEVISVSSIQESYDLRVPLEVNANLTCESTNKAATIMEQLVYEESPNINVEESKCLTPKLNFVESSIKPVQSSTVSVFENIEGHGDFKPQSAQPTSDISTDLSISVVEEVSVISSIDSISKVEPTKAKAIENNVTHKNLLVTRQEPIENVQHLLENTIPALQCASYATTDAKVAPLYCELQVKETILETSSSKVDLEHAKPSILPYSSSLNQQTITEEQVTTLHMKNQTLPTNANISYETNPKNQVDILNLAANQNLVYDLEMPTIEERENALQKILFVPDNVNVLLPLEATPIKDAQCTVIPKNDKSHTDLELHSEPKMQSTKLFDYESLSTNILNQTVKSHPGKYYVRVTLSNSTEKGVLLPILLVPRSTKHILHKTITKIQAELRLKAYFLHRYKTSH